MHGRSGRQQENWTKLVKNQSWVSWSGFAFERLCFTHTDQIKKALGLSVIQTQIYGWKSQNDDEGAQIDLIIDRADNIIHLCEIKFCNATFVIDKSYAAKLRNKVASFSKVVKRKPYSLRWSLLLALWTTNIIKNWYKMK